MPPTVHLYRHDSVVCSRPYGFDVDPDDTLWEGVNRDIITHNLRTGAYRVFTIPEMQNRVAYQCFAWQGRIVITLVDFYLIYDPKTGRGEPRKLPGENPIVWYGTKVRGDAGESLVLFERAGGHAVVLDNPCDEPRVFKCPYPGDFASGTHHSDGLIYVMLSDPARLLRFDPSCGRFEEPLALPWPEAGISSRFEHAGTLYCTDSAGGRFLPLDMKTQKWGEPIPVPGYGQVFGFIGAGFQFKGKSYTSLSTYAHRSRLDLKTGKIIMPKEGDRITVDGRSPRFLERMLEFDFTTKKFDYLFAPPQADGIPLLCYTWTDGERFAVTGQVLPFHEPGVVDALDNGAWMVMQSLPVTEKPFGPPSGKFNRDAFIQQYRRGYPVDRSLYLAEAPHTPPIKNMYGPGTSYSPGREAELLRRAQVTDSRQYWKDLADHILKRHGEISDARKVWLILGYINIHIFYNPIQVPSTFDPIAIMEAHDGRCGHVVNICLRLFEAAGLEARQAQMVVGHTVAEVKYDGAWHIADALFFGVIQPQRDGRVLSVAELKADPYFVDAYPQECFAYDPELLMSRDGYQVLGYVFGVWGSEPYYSYYLGGVKEHPPTLPTMLPAQRAGGQAVRLNWSRSIKFNRPNADIEYDVRVFTDRAGREEIWKTTTRETSAEFAVPEMMRMYFAQVRAMDDQRKRNPNTWYPAAKWNFVLAPENQYGWYGVL